MVDMLLMPCYVFVKNECCALSQGVVSIIVLVLFSGRFDLSIILHGSLLQWV
jgi:hypothetical protein